MGVSLSDSATLTPDEGDVTLFTSPSESQCSMFPDHSLSAHLIPRSGRTWNGLVVTEHHVADVPADNMPPRMAMLLIAAIVGIVAIDLWIRGSETLLIHGIADEIAHLLTAVVCVEAFRVLGTPIRWPAALTGAVVLDLDHIPLIYGWAEPLAGSTRPETHALWPVMLVMVGGLAYRDERWIWWSIAIGMSTHLFRDTATGTVVLLWPFEDIPVHIPYIVYLLVMWGGVLVARLGLRRDWRAEG